MSNATTQTAGAESDPRATAIWLIRALRKNWPAIVATTVLGTGGALLFSKSLPKVYESSAMVEFDPDVIKPLGNKADPMIGWSAFWDTQQYYETQYRIMVSDRVLSVVMRDLSLQNDAEFLGYTPTEPAPADQTIEILRGKIAIDPVKNSRLVNIRVSDTSPAQARRLADAVARSYIQQNLDKTVSATNDTAVWLSGQLDHFRGELEQNENALHDFKRRNDLPSSTIDEVSKMIRMEMQEFDGALTRTRMRRQELQARHAELSKITTDNVEQIPASELLTNGFLQQLRHQYQEAVRERRELVALGKGENHPTTRKAEEKITLARQLLVEEVRNIQGAVSRDLAVLERQEGGEAGLYEEARKKAVELNLKELEFHRLDRLRAQNEKIYGMLLEQLKEADLRRMMNTNNIRLVDPPTEPKAPVRPNVPTNTLFGLLAGLGVGIVLALMREQLDSSLKTPEDIEQKLGVTFLGLLPEVEEEERRGSRRKRSRRLKPRELSPELVVHEQPTSGIAEAARALRTNLMFMNPDAPYRTILVTSSSPSEGKTTVACCVAVSLAQSGQRVCIIDCDLRRPRLHRIFDRAGDSGLTNVLIGDATLDDVALPTVVPNLYSIPCGPIPPNPADMLQSERFKNLLEELSHRFDRIVLDSPPVVAVTDSAILSTIVDGTIYVVRAFKTSQAVVQSGLRSLRDVDAPIIGLVLNAVDLGRHEYSYYHYYYYKREGYAPLQHSATGDAPTDERSADAAPPPH